MQNKYIRVPQRVASFGERMNNKRLAELQKIKDKRRTIKARRLAKENTSVAPDNDVS